MSRVTCHMPGVMCQASGVAFSSSHFLLLLFTKWWELVGGGSVINRAYPVYITPVWDVYIYHVKLSVIFRTTTLFHESTDCGRPPSG